MVYQCLSLLAFGVLATSGQANVVLTGAWVGGEPFAAASDGSPAREQSGGQAVAGLGVELDRAASASLSGTTASSHVVDRGEYEGSGRFRFRSSMHLETSAGVYPQAF